MPNPPKQGRVPGRSIGRWLCVGVGVAGVIALFEWRRGALSSAPPSTPPVAASSQAAPLPTAGGSLAAAAFDMRARILQAIEAHPVTTALELEPYLAQLEARAREQGAVTALEVEPGMAMAQQFADLERAMAFGERMAALQQELSGKAPNAPLDVASIRSELESTLAEIKVSSRAKKQELIKQYLARVAALPPDEADDAYSKINAAASQAQAPTDLDTVEALWKGIEKASDEDHRQALIREYLELVHDLPEAEAARRLEALNRRFGSQGR